jgi:hypothetical protein
VNAVILILGDSLTQFLLYADLVTIRNSECSAIYGNILDSTVCVESVTATVTNACDVSFLQNLLFECSCGILG